MNLRSSVARGGLEPPHWPEKYAKHHVFNAFEDDFRYKNKNSSPQWDWQAKVVKDLLLFGLKRWSFYFLYRI